MITEWSRAVTPFGSLRLLAYPYILLPPVSEFLGNVPT